MRYGLVLAVPALFCASVMAQDNVALPAEVYQTPGPHVVVNGVLLKAPVREVGGSLFLPMRAVFEALQAEVKWFPAAQQIEAKRGATVVQLWIKRPVAIVNGQEVRLSAPPALMDGTTYVPLRFPAEAFGGEVKWLGAVRTAAITIAPLKTDTAEPSETGARTEPAPVPQTGALEGVIVTKVTTGVTALVIRNAKGETTLVEIASGAVVTRANIDGTPQPATFASLELGDKVNIVRDASGKASKVEARYALVKGVAAAIANNRLLLEDGTLYQLQPDIRVVHPDGKDAPLAQVVKGTPVTLDLTPDTTNVWRITIPESVAQTRPKPAGDAQHILTVAAVGYTKPLKAGEKLTIQVTGTPNAERVTASVGDVLRNLRLTETAPGSYTREVTIGANTNVTAVPIVAVMRVDGKDTTPVKSPTPVTIDTRPPSFDALIPGDASRVLDRNPTVEAAYSDPGGSGVDAASVRIRVNGRNVTKQATVTDARVRYRSNNLALGNATIEIGISDLAGNAAAAQWSIVVADAPGTGVRYVRHDASKPLVAGQKLTIAARIPSNPQKIEWYLGNKLVSRSMTRDAAADEYRATYTIAAEDAAGEYSVSARVYMDDDQGQVLFATDPVTVVAKQRAFRITAPADKSRAPSPLVISGEATPGTEVRVTVDYESRVAFLPVKGRLFSGVVKADSRGIWSTDSIETGGMLIRPDTYTVTAESLDAKGDVIHTARITLTRR